MCKQPGLAICLFASLAAFDAPAPVRAAVPYNGTYVIFDPYDGSVGGALSQLMTSSTATCPGSDPLACGSTSGIVLKIGWCSFQLFHNDSYPGVGSCHYDVELNEDGSSMQVQNPDLISNCGANYLYDTCSTGILAQALAYIQAINATRHAAGNLPPLKISVGMSAGRWTPQDVLDQVGPKMQPSYVDVPDSTGSGRNKFCYRLPVPWRPAYLASFDNAFQALTSFIANAVGSNNIATLKLAGMNANDLELSVPGAAISVMAPVDNGPPTVGPLISCPPQGISGAQVWLAAFQNEPDGYATISDAFESTFGSIAGYEAALISTTFPTAELSQATVGAAAFPDIDCGVGGSSSSCAPNKTDDWTGYYFWKYLKDLLPPGGLARSAASAAYAAATNGGVLALTASQLSIDWTGLSAAPVDTLTNVECWSSNTTPSHDVKLKLDGSYVTIYGINTVNGFQTMENQGHYCSLSGGDQYAAALANVMKNGGVYVEVETDAAYAPNGACDADLSAITKALATAKPAACYYAAGNRRHYHR